MIYIYIYMCMSICWILPFIILPYGTDDMFTENVAGELVRCSQSVEKSGKKPTCVYYPTCQRTKFHAYLYDKLCFIIFNLEDALRKMKIMKRKRELRVSILKVMGFQHPFLKRNNIEYLLRSHVETIHDSFSYVCFSHVLLREPRSANTQVGGVFYSKTEGILFYH